MREGRACTGQALMHQLCLLGTDAHAVNLCYLLAVPSEKPEEILVLTARANDQIFLTLAEEFLQGVEMRRRTH